MRLCIQQVSICVFVSVSVSVYVYVCLQQVCVYSKSVRVFSTSVCLQQVFVFNKCVQQVCVCLQQVCVCLQQVCVRVCVFNKCGLQKRNFFLIWSFFYKTSLKFVSKLNFEPFTRCLIISTWPASAA